jgi:hypothetical protein
MESKTTIDREYLNQCDGLIDELCGLGDKAIPAIKSAVVGSRVALQSALLCSLSKIKTPLGNDTVLEFALQDSDKRLSEAATGDLIFREIHRPLMQHEFSRLDAKLEAGFEPEAVSVAEFLTRCGHNDARQRVKAIIARFIALVRQPPRIRRLGGYLSSEASWCNQYILCLQKLDQTVVRELLKSELAQAKDNRVTTWLMIAGGMLGEESLAEDLCRIVESETDVSVRAMALRGYARTAKQKAVPFLRHFVNDRIPGGADCHGVYPLQIVARDELAELEGRRP